MDKLTFAALPEVLNAEQIAGLLGVSRATAYNLLNSDGFPTLHIGSRKLVTKDNLLTWLDAHTDRVA